MIYLTSNSSIGITGFSNHSTFHELANSTQFQPISQTPAYVVGELLLRIASAVYSKLPSFSLPFAFASPPECISPSGTYETSCHRPVVTYLPTEGLCELTTRCATIFEGLPHQRTSVRFSPSDSGILLENRNGTLVRLAATIIEDLTPGAVITAPKNLIKSIYEQTR